MVETRIGLRLFACQLQRQPACCKLFGFRLSPHAFEQGSVNLMCARDALSAFQ
ncbi:MAG: hypothetical protein U0X75_29515 [Acidobacteriota bacterium]